MELSGFDGQLRVQGEYNVLVATSIGEEGLDIGEVDLIICYDALGSATRTTQAPPRAYLRLELSSRLPEI